MLFDVTYKDSAVVKEDEARRLRGNRQGDVAEKEKRLDINLYEG